MAGLMFMREAASARSQGQTYYVNSAGKIARLNAGTSGYFLKTLGAGADPVWASASLDINGLTQTRIIDPVADFAAIYDASATANRKVTPDMFVPRGYIDGFLTANDGTDPSNDYVVNAGVCRDDTDVTTIRLSSAIIGRLDGGTWVVGTNQPKLDAGSEATSTWYAVYAIMRSDTGVCDILFSTSFTAPTMPANYDYKRRIGSFYNQSSSIIRPFSDLGQGIIIYAATILDVDVTNQGTTRTLRNMSIPPIACEWLGGTYAYTSGENVYITSPAQTDEAESSAAARVTVRGADSTTNAIRCWSNSSGQVGSVGAAANTNLRMSTYGHVDPRGQA